MSFGVYCSDFSTLSTRTEEIIGFSGEETSFLALIKKTILGKKKSVVGFHTFPNS